MTFEEKINGIVNEGYVITREGDVYNKHGLKRKLQKSRNGYLSFCFWFQMQYKRVDIHRIVAYLYAPNPQNKLEVNHKDGDKTNNNVNNLEWVTRSENHKHAYRTGIRRVTWGVPINKIDPDSGAVVESYESIMEAAEWSKKKYNNIYSALTRHKGQDMAYGYKWDKA
jgi:hypothetical protein